MPHFLPGQEYNECKSRTGRVKFIIKILKIYYLLLLLVVQQTKQVNLIIILNLIIVA